MLLSFSKENFAILLLVSYVYSYYVSQAGCQKVTILRKNSFFRYRPKYWRDETSESGENGFLLFFSKRINKVNRDTVELFSFNFILSYYTRGSYVFVIDYIKHIRNINCFEWKMNGEYSNIYVTRLILTLCFPYCKWFVRIKTFSRETKNGKKTSGNISFSKCRSNPMI